MKTHISEKCQALFEEKYSSTICMVLDLLRVDSLTRSTARECLGNKMFDPYRNAVKENIINEVSRNRYQEGNP